jgi:hypothetical protein
VNRPPRPWNEVVDLDDAPAVTALGAAIRDWDPSLELEIPPRDALLFEPDGTLYAVQLRAASEFRVRSRIVTVRRGDLVVVPRGQAVDAGPEVDLVAVRHLGAPPDHFRERFIQVWGVDLHPAPPPDPGRSGLTEVVSLADVRLRVPYAIGSFHGRIEPDSPRIQATEPLLLIGLEGETVVEPASPTDGPRLVVRSRCLLAMPPGQAVHLGGEGRIGVMTLMNDLTHAARRHDPRLGSGRPSPEFRPNAPRESD